ncbi:MAG: tRNA (adenosine(37)-N6)-threonylcarbamoyltransferase complex ATPase subunit type 1 TsaE [Chloroflexi bacterium RBG_13_57_8]|nr:MAG: tRNA (adenosine(37)-N6)-threonylcarbamoyltransferase complex ATPase subunit type 1 TsaE [Chloroflexi bacterium RBG_13_57_8]
MELEFFSQSPAATLALGKKIGGRLPAGSVLALTGELGCGKTLFTRGLSAGLDVPLRLVNSPTFVLVNEYPGRLPVFHLDLYRIGSEADGVELGITDYLQRAEAGAMIIEWAEKIWPLLPPDLLKVEFEIISSRRRRLVFSSAGQKFDGLLKVIKQS